MFRTVLSSSVLIIAVGLAQLAQAEAPGPARTVTPDPPRIQPRTNHVTITHQTVAAVPSVGPALAPVTIEFFCRVADRHTSMRIYRRLMQLHKRHPTRLRIVFHLVGYGKRFLTKAALGAHAQGKFRTFLDAVWLLNHRFRQKGLKGLVERLGLAWAPIKRMVDDKRVDAVLTKNIQLQRDRRVTYSRTGYMSFNGVSGRNRNFRYASLAVYENMYDAAYARAKLAMARGVGLARLHATLVRSAELSRPPVAITTGRTDNGPYRSNRPRTFRGKLDHSGPHSKGPTDARVVVVFACSFSTTNCASTWRSLRYAYNQFPGQVRIVFKHLYHQSLSRQRHAPLVHQGSMCADEQGAFWKFANSALSYRRTNYWRRGRVLKMMSTWVTRYGLDSGRFTSCVNSGRYARRVRAAVRTSKTAGFRFTPTIVVGGTVYEGYMRSNVIGALIREQLRPGILERMWPLGDQTAD